MTSGQLLTVVIPVYNRAHCVVRTLDSVAAQTLRPLRLIVVDNNSTDDSLKVVEEWAGRHRSADFDISVLIQPVPGASAARNLGLKNVETPWVLFFDSDDVMDSDHIARIDAEIRANPETEIVGWDGESVYPDGSRKKEKFSSHDTLWYNLIHGSMATLRYCAKTELFRKAGGWNEQISVWDDMELGVRLLLLKPRVVKIEGKPRVHFDISPFSISSMTLDSNRAELSLDSIEKALHEAGRDDMLRWVDLRRVQLAADYHRNGLKEDARRLLKSVTSRRGRWFQIIYLKHRLYRRGTYLMLHR